MMTEVSPSPFGLGPELGGAGKTRFFYHGGVNEGYRAWVEGHLGTGDGLVILTNGANGIELFSEIRNSVADMLGWRIDQPVQTIHLDPSERKHLEDFAGSYHADDGVPMNMRQAIVNFSDRFEVRVKNSQLFLALPGHKKGMALLPLTPTRFVVPSQSGPGETLQIVFHRGADNHVRAFTVEMEPARAYYTRDNPDTR